MGMESADSPNSSYPTALLRKELGGFLSTDHVRTRYSFHRLLLLGCRATSDRHTPREAHPDQFGLWRNPVAPEVHSFSDVSFRFEVIEAEEREAAAPAQ